jgi:hypothetical protein
MDDAEIDALKNRVAQLEAEIATLQGVLGQAVQLVDRYTDTLGQHLKLTLTDQGDLARRIAALERLLSG